MPSPECQITSTPESYIPHGRLLGASGVGPVSGVNLLNLNVGIHGFCAELKALMSTENLGGIRAAYHADLARLGGQGRDHAHQITAALQRHIVNRRVVNRLVSGSQQEFGIRIVGGNLDDGFHKLESMAEHHVVALVRKVHQRRLNVRHLVHVLHNL